MEKRINLKETTKEEISIYLTDELKTAINDDDFYQFYILQNSENEKPTIVKSEERPVNWFFHIRRGWDADDSGVKVFINDNEVGQIYVDCEDLINSLMRYIGETY